MKYASEILQIASNLVNGDRQNQHGDKVTNHNNIARLWSAYLDKNITANDVALMMTLLKVARTKCGSHNIDNYIDGAGYMGVAGEIITREKDKI